jgi:hypothetical protein
MRPDIIRPDIILVQKKLLSVKIGKILEGGARMIAFLIENANSKSELINFTHFPWKAYRSDPDRVPLVFGKEKS